MTSNSNDDCDVGSPAARVSISSKLMRGPHPSAVGWATIAGVLVALGAWLFPDVDRNGAVVGSQPSELSGPASASGPTTANSESGEDPADSAGLTAGTCLNEESERFLSVPCDTPHQWEAIPMADGCSPDDAYSYVGGNPAVDVLRSDLRAVEINGSCMLGIPGATVDTTLRNALSLDDSPALRECSNRLTNQFVSCADPHTGEVVHRVDRESNVPLDCETEAEEYMGISAGRVFRMLDVLASQGEPRRCIVEVRDDTKYLVSPLRNIGAGSIQTAPID